MRKFKLHAVLLAAAIAAGCSTDARSPLGADDLAASRAAEQTMLFQARYNFTPNLQPHATCGDPAMGQLADIGSGTGLATHLGRFVGRNFSCVDLGTGQVTGLNFTFTNRFGESITGTYEARATFLSETLVQLYPGTFTITGGTGRFAGATGGGSFAGQVDLATGQGVLLFDGRISAVPTLR
jgi:opacity protein-like surface antigen